MGSVNKVILIGRLGKDPEKITTDSGKSLVNISLATNEYFSDKTGAKQKRVEWHRIVLWERLAQIVTQYCQKGSSIYVEGSLRTNEWTDKEGQKRYTTQIVGNKVQLLSGNARDDNESWSGTRNDDKRANNKDPFSVEPAGQTDDGFTEDDIPF